MSFGNCARSLIVPVVGSIWLSKVCRVPSAILLAPLRSSAVAGRTAPACSRFEIACRLSSGTVNRTLIGCNCVITTRPLASPGVT